MNFETISAKNLDAYIGRSDCMIIDLREEDEYRQGHIMSAYNVPYERLEQAFFRKDITYIMYCERGSASLAAAKELAKKGYRVKSVVGGIRAYRGKYLTGVYGN